MGKDSTTLSSISQSHPQLLPHACEASFDQILQVGRLSLSRTFLQHCIWATPQLAQHFLFRSRVAFLHPGKRQREECGEKDFSHPQHPSLPPAMEREVIFCPKWHSAPWVLLLMMLCFFHADKAEITCRSCQPGNKWRAQELLLKFDTSESATGLKGEVFGHGDGASAAASAESRRLRCAAGSAECAPARAEYTEPRWKRNTDNLRAKDEIGEGEFAQMKVSHVDMSGQLKTSDGAGVTSATGYRKRARRHGDDGKVGSPGLAQSQDPGESVSSAAGRRVTRSELRWSGEERRAAGPRQEELKLNSSTFALTGDSSHNQAMVHWSGQNSSVSDLLCPL